MTFKLSKKTAATTVSNLLQPSDQVTHLIGDLDELALRKISGGVFGVAFVLEHVSPQSPHGVGIEGVITADDGDVFDHRLSDDQPIEWIAVM